MPLGGRVKALLLEPWLPFWLVVALLPVGRTSELGTLLCMIGTVFLFLREPRALSGHAGARLLLWLFAAYTGAALVSAFDAADAGKSWSSVAGYLRYAPFGVYACFALRRESKLRALYLATGLVVALWALDAWVQLVTGWSLGGPSAELRLSGIFGADNLKLGPALAALSAFALWSARDRWGLRGLVLAFVFLLLPVLLAGSRAAWLSYALVGLCFVWRESRTPLRFAAWCSGIALVAVIACVAAWQFSPRFESRLERTLLVLNGPQGWNTALSGRFTIWHRAAQMFVAHPINGVGVRSFRYAYPDYAPADGYFMTVEACGPDQGACHAHQIVLEVASETGAIGLVMWLGAVWLALRAWWRVGPAARTRAFPASVALGVSVFPLTTHLAFYSAWWGLLFWWLLALWCAALYVVPRATNPQPGKPLATV